MNDMDKICPGVEALAGWLEGSLSPEDRSGVASHLAGCDECRRAVAIASTLEAAAPASGVNEILLSKVIAGSRRRRLAPMLSAAAAVLAAIGFTYLLSRPTPPRETPVAVQTSPKVAADPPAAFVPAPPSPPPTPAPAAPEVPPREPVVAEGPKKEAPKPIILEPVAPRPATSDPAPGVESTPLVKETPAAPTAEDKVLSPVFATDPVGDLWVRRERSEAKAGLLEKAASKDLFSARAAGAAFSLEARASVVLEKGAEAAFAYVKTEQSYNLALGQGLVMLDTEGSSQKWRITFGKSQLDFSEFNGRLAVESRGDQMSATLLDGRAEMRIGAAARTAEVGKEVVLSREGAVIEQKGETQKKLARLDELRPKMFTAFAATFDEKKDDFLPYPYTVVSGRLGTVAGPVGLYLQSDVVAASKAGEKNTLTAAIRPDRVFPVMSGMVLKFKYRTSLPSFSVKIGKYSADLTSRIRTGQWADGEIPLQNFSFEGTPLLPSDPVEEVRFIGSSDKKTGQLDIDGVQFVRKTR